MKNYFKLGLVFSSFFLFLLIALILVSSKQFPAQELIIVESGFKDQGSSSNNEDLTSRDYRFEFQAFAKGNDFYISPEDVNVFVQGASLPYVSFTVDSTAEKDSRENFFVAKGKTETFNVSVTLSSVSATGQYSVGLNSIGTMAFYRPSFETAYALIHQSNKKE